MDWTPDERRFFRSLKTPDHIQDYIDSLIYNPEDSCASPRYTMMTETGHCFEAALVAAAALEFQGQPPMLVDLMAWDDDHHVLIVYKTRTGWGSLSKSNTTLLAGRRPFYRDVRELVMSYFDFYFNTKNKLALYAYATLNLNRYNHWNWRTTDEDLMEMGMSFCDEDHYQIVDPKILRKLRPVKQRLADACFLGANPDGLYKA